MRILALDQSSKITGYAIFEENKLIKSGTYNATGSNLDYRLEKIRQWLNNIITVENIDKVFLEDIQLENNIGNNVSTYKILAEVIGVITELLVELKVDYEILASNVWRKRLSLWAPDRAACKQRAKQYVKTKYKLDVSEDTCDAICIGEAGLNTKIENTGFDWS